jgi:hypothetical protein
MVGAAGFGSACGPVSSLTFQQLADSVRSTTLLSVIRLNLDIGQATFARLHHARHGIALPPFGSTGNARNSPKREKNEVPAHQPINLL